MEIAVKQAKQADFAAVAHLYDQVVAQNTGTKYDVLWRRDLHPTDQALQDAINAGALYVAIADDAIVGACVINNDFAPGYESIDWPSAAAPADTRCLHLFCTHPDLHGQGIGAQFLKQLLPLMSLQGIKALRLDVFDNNAPAKHLYEKVGFELAGITYLQYEDQDVSILPFALYEFAL